MMLLLTNIAYRIEAMTKSSDSGRLLLLFNSDECEKQTSV